MIQNNNIVTAPRVPSSPSVNYYDPRGHPFYAHQQSAPVHNNHYLNTSAPLHSTVNSTAAVAAAAAAAAAVGVDLNTSLPPLSRLLPPTANDSRTVRSQGVYKTPPLGHRFDDVYMVHQHLPYNDVFHPPSVRSHQLPSPPTSVIDSVMMSGDALTNHHQKVFSFVPLPGVQQKKRPRRKYHEVERLYKCNYQNCTKAYGTLNHLNAHVSMQKHASIHFYCIRVKYLPIL